ncbi:hypothetical protein GCM10027427_00180 [Pseudoclavibacter terrae]
MRGCSRRLAGDVGVHVDAPEGESSKWVTFQTLRLLDCPGLHPVLSLITLRAGPDRLDHVCAWPNLPLIHAGNTEHPIDW